MVFQTRYPSWIILCYIWLLGFAHTGEAQAAKEGKARGKQSLFWLIYFAVYLHEPTGPRRCRSRLRRRATLPRPPPPPCRRLGATSGDQLGLVGPWAPRVAGDRRALRSQGSPPGPAWRGWPASSVLFHPSARVLRCSRRAWPFFRDRPVSGASVRVGLEAGECSCASPAAFPEGPRLPRLRAHGILATRSLRRRRRRRGPVVGARLPRETMRPRGEAARAGPGLDLPPGGLATAGSLPWEATEWEVSSHLAQVRYSGTPTGQPWRKPWPPGISSAMGGEVSFDHSIRLYVGIFPCVSFEPLANGKIPFGACSWSWGKINSVKGSVLLLSGVTIPDPIWQPAYLMLIFRYFRNLLRAAKGGRC